MVFIEIKVNKEIREYTESLFFGLSARQCVFSVLAIGVAVGIYFLLIPHIGLESVSWLCILGAAPFAACGFFKYHGMNAEQFFMAWVRSVVLSNSKLLFKPENMYYEILKDNILKSKTKKDDAIENS